MQEPLGPPGGFWLLSIDQPDWPITDKFGFTSGKEKCPNPEDSLPPRFPKSKIRAWWNEALALALALRFPIG